MFDRFKALARVEKFDFTFVTSRYEVWMNQKKVKYDKVVTTIVGKVIPYDDSSKVKVFVNIPELSQELADNTIFDIFVSQTDRLQLLIIPEITATDCNGLVAVRTVFGPSMKSKNFAKNEPYCCSLFFKDSKLNKVTFSFSNPGKLIEFYCDCE